MQANFLKRVGAYMVDMVIILLIINLLSPLMPMSMKEKALREELNVLYENNTKQEITLEEYTTKFAQLTLEIDKVGVMNNVMLVIVIIGYFVFLPYFFMGQTLGKRLFQIRIVRNDGSLLMLNELVIRNFVINGLAYLLATLLLVYILPGVPYLIAITLLGLLQIALVMATAIMMIVRKDHKGIQDLITGTHVVYEEKRK